MDSSIKGLPVTDRFAQRKVLDIFYEPYEKGHIFNRNGVFIGPSGTGKSFTMNALLYFAKVQGAHITIVDIGHSYRRLGEVLEANYISHDVDKPISLNPFYYSSPSQISTEFKGMIVQILSILFKKSTDPLTKSQDVALAELVNEYYTFLQNDDSIKPNFNSLFEFADIHFRKIFKEKLKGRDEIEFDINNFLFNLRPFYKGGVYDFLLNSDKEEDLSQIPLLIYDIDNLRDNEILLPIVILIITNTYVSQLFSVKNKLKILIIEEAWKAISNEFFAEFLLWAFKTARKHGGSIFVVTQDIEDIKKSKAIGDAIINNTQIKILMDLRQYKQDIEGVLTLFNVNRSDLGQIFSINKKPFDRSNFNEFAVIMNGKCKVFGLDVPRLAYALFTTTPNEVYEINKIAQTRGISQKEAAMVWAVPLP
jgi:conjugation system TraG family ATPase